MMLCYSGIRTAVWLCRCEKTLIIKGVFLCRKLAQADFNLQLAFIRVPFHKGHSSFFICISKIKWIYK